MAAVSLVIKPIDGMPATHAHAGTIGFTTSSPAPADAWRKSQRREGAAPRSRTQPGVR